MVSRPSTSGVIVDREKKDLKVKQAKHSMESVKSVMSDKSVKNKAERDRCVDKISPCSHYRYAVQRAWTVI